MGSVVAVLNMKGGTGKSTVATNLARGLQRHGEACIVDADPQGTALRWGNAQPEDADMPPVVSAGLPLDDRIPSVAEGWDFTVVDGAAKAKDRTRQCAEVADAVLIPIRPSGADIWASEWLVSVVKGRREATASGATATEASPSGKPAAAFVVSQAIVGTNLAGEIEEVLGRFELPVFEGRTSQRVAYAEALSLGKTVLDTDPSGKAAAEVERITEETLQLLTDSDT
jgi:chromosome partitioning protein